MKNRERISPRLPVLAIAVLALCGSVQAAPDGTYSVDPKDLTGRVLPGFYPNVELDLGYDDNVGRTQRNTDSSVFGMLKPELQWNGVFGKHLVRIGYLGEYANYFDISDENYRDHFLGGDVTLDLTQKLNVNGGVAYSQGHESRGVSGAANSGLKPNEWEQWSAKLEALYGRRIATAQIGARYEYFNRDYTNNNQFLRNNDTNTLTLIGFYNLGPKTRLLIEPSISEVDYTNPASNQDNTKRKILAGVTWDATAKTSGTVKVGKYDTSYDNLPDTDGLAINANVIWKPKTYSKVTLRASNDSYDSSIGGASSYDAAIIGVDWEHDLSDITQLQAGAEYESDDYSGASREDDFVSAYVGLSRAVTRNITVGARYEFETRDSSIPLNDYDDNTFLIGVKTAFE